MSKYIKFTSLFANAGIGTFLTKEVGFECSVANEFLLDRSQLHQDLHGNDCYVEHGDITNDDTFEKLVELHKERGCVGVMATPPCQPFSLAGGQHLDDPEALLFLDALKFVERTLPDWFFMENVPQFISDNQPKFFTDKLDGKTVKQYIIDFFAKYPEYTLNIGVLNASLYSKTPQSRDRAIILARKNKKWDFPEKIDVPMTVRDAIGHFKSLEPLERDPDDKFHYASYVDVKQAMCLRHTPTGQSPLFNKSPWIIKNINGTPSKAQHKTAYGRIEWDKPAPTIIMASNSISGDNSVHPGRLIKKTLPNGKIKERYSDPRPLTLAEIFALTGLGKSFCDAIPDWAEPNESLLREVIGEALMPLFANAILSTLHNK